MPSVAQYYPGDFQGEMAQTLAWLYSRQNVDVGNWQANALLTSLPVTQAPGAAQVATNPALAECGIVSQADFSSLPVTTIENLSMLPPAGWLFDKSLGPDGFPIDFSPVALPTGNLFAPVIPLTSGQIQAFYDAMYNASPRGAVICGVNYPVLQGMTIYGYVFNLFATPGQNDIEDYRVDLFVLTDQYYYQSSAPGVGVPQTGVCKGVNPRPSQFQSLLTQQGLNGYWGAQVTNPGVAVAALYPVSVPQPTQGWSGRALPAGWLCHSNTGVGQALGGYFARIYAKTDIEYLQEDNIPIIVQDPYHARCGSSVIPAAGELTVHVLYQDPVKGPTLVYTSLQNEAAYQDLPRSFTVPTSDLLYVPDPTQSNQSALQNRSFIYDCALALITYSAVGNSIAASKIIKQINFFLDNPGYLATTILENGEDNNSAARWTKSNSADSVTDVNDPTQPPYGTGLVVDFHATTANDSFTYSGAGFPDATDGQLQFQHKEVPTVTFVFDVSVATTNGSVTDVQVTSGVPAPASYNAGTKMITIAVGPGGGFYRTELLNLESLISTLADDTLTSITGFKITLTAAGDMYFDNLSIGGLQPENSLAFSYDVYNGQIDQAYIRTGAMAWVCYAYAVYMALSLDYTPALYLQRLINFLLTLQSTANDLTNTLFYLGLGEYKDPGYQFVPGLLASVSTEHNVDIYFTFMRCSGILQTAAVQLLKTGTITKAQSESLQATAAQIQTVAETVASQLLANLYIAPGSRPGHFAQGASAAGLDVSEAADASGTWAAVMCYTVGATAQAEQCLEFVYQNFLLSNQQILKFSISNSYNQAYQQLTSFSGTKAYNDSAGGYSGSPASVSQEQTWGLILALLVLHGDQNVQSYFAGVAGSLDAFLATLVSSQRTVRATTGDGSLIGYSLASRGLPYEFEVWPMFSATAWMWLVSNRPDLLLSVSSNPQVFPYLSIPQGASQTVNELDGASSVGAVTLKCIDPAGVLKGLTSQDSLIGKVAQIKMGFPGQSLGDFTTLHTMQINQTGWTADGQVTFTLHDVQRFLLGQQIWLRGGPLEWTPGNKAKAPQPIGPAVGANAFPVSEKNPRYLQGNPLNLLLATLQNELGVGQDPSLRGSDYVLERAISVYTDQQNYKPLGPAPGWVIFRPGDDSTLINPNPYIDVPGFLALRDTEYSGDWFEFQIQRPTDGKQFIEDQILKVLGLYLIVRPDGRLGLKSMKSPAVQTPVMALNQKNVIGIPATSRQPVVNVVTVKMNVENSGVTTAARAYDFQVSFEQQESLIRYNQIFQQQIEATGLVLPYGGMMRAQMIADRIFRRHAFAPPVYKAKVFLSALVVELGDFVWLTHPLVADFQTGKMGLASVVCEVIGKRPNYAAGNVEFDLLDTRFINLTKPYYIAPAAAGVPDWTGAGEAQKQQYMFISQAASGGAYADGTAGNTIF